MSVISNVYSDFDQLKDSICMHRGCNLVSGKKLVNEQIYNQVMMTWYLLMHTIWDFHSNRQSLKYKGNVWDMDIGE